MAPPAEPDPDAVDELDSLEFDPQARDVLGDFGLDEEEALPDSSDFWFDSDEELDDW